MKRDRKSKGSPRDSSSFGHPPRPRSAAPGGKSAKGGEALGGLKLGGLLRGFGDLIDLAAELTREGKQEVSRTGEIHGSGRLKDLRGVYGFTVRAGLGGEPAVQTFGNIRETESGPVVEEAREPIVDVFDEGEVIRILAELPGVSMEEISMTVQDDILTLAAGSQDRKYSKEILLPSKVEAASLKTTFKNGILEVVAAKEGQS